MKWLTLVMRATLPVSFMAGELHGSDRAYSGLRGRARPWYREGAGKGGAAAVAEELLESFKARYPFPLDDFQLRAIARRSSTASR